MRPPYGDGHDGCMVTSRAAVDGASSIRYQSPELTRRVMQSNRARDTKPELALRRELHARGVRYRLHPGDVVGRPDIVLRGLRLAVFVDGDFWHGNRWRLRGLARLEDDFHNNRDFWVAKITRNVQRDREVNQRLADDGWTVLRVWESDVLRDVAAAADRVQEAIDAARRSTRA